MTVRSRVSVFLLMVVFLAGCCGKASSPGGARPGQAGGPELVPHIPGKLLVTGQTTLDLIAGGHRTTVERAANNFSYFEYPVFSPDGSKVAYVLATVPTTAQTQNWGNDIYTANVDGSDVKLVLQHDHPGALVDSLSWTPDGSSLVYAYSLTQYDAAGHYTGLIQRVERLLLGDRSRIILLSNAIQPSVSRDGKQILYVDSPSDDSRPPSLALASIDGAGSKKLLTNQKGFQTFFAPHLSPDGRRVVFAAVGGPLGAQPGASFGGLLAARPPAKDVAAGVLAWVRVPTAEADGSPFQVWVANIDGSDLHTLGDLREDLPYPLWSSDGQSILFLGAGGLYLANADGTNMHSVGAGVPHGQIAWYEGAGS